ncbi:MAG: hypothetical protein JW969_16365 [Spirochaetales bacterium]|nr:hypothetical protein [Spirochaetales bacterium]
MKIRIISPKPPMAAEEECHRTRPWYVVITPYLGCPRTGLPPRILAW